LIPTITDLTSAPLVHRFGDLFNPPALTNFRGTVQVALDITAIRGLSFPPFSCSDSFPPVTWSDSVTGALFVDGHYFPSTGEPVTFTWRPDRIIRTATCRGLDLKSETILAVGKMAALVRLRVTNVSGQRRRASLRFGLKSSVAMDPWGWNGSFAPAEYDNEVIPDDARNALAFCARHSPAVSLQGVVPRAGRLGVNGLDVERELEPGESCDLVYINAIAEEADEARATYDELAADADAEFLRAEQDWNRELQAVFTPGNDRYSGSLPRLETSDDDVLRLYHQGMLGLVYFKRELPAPHIGRTYTTLMPRYWQTITWLWDYQLGSSVHAMLDPAITVKLLGHWLACDVHHMMGTDWLTGQGVGEPYAVNDFAMCKIVYDYVRWSGDVRWLKSSVTSVSGDERPIIDRVLEYARSWEHLKGDGGLADYGGVSNLLECVDGYAHEVVGLNAANIFSLRAAADLVELLGNVDEAGRLRFEATRLLRQLQAMYVDGEGCWYTRQPGGELIPVRHCLDLHMVLNTIGDDLSERQRSEMVRLFTDELRTPTWMHALSPRDAGAIFDIRPDHQWTGAYAAWPAETAAALMAAGEDRLVMDWLRGIAVTARQGPFGQAHFAETVVDPDAGGARKAPSEFPYLTDWACSAAGAWARLVIESMFGVDATLTDGLHARPRIDMFDADARLVNVPYQGRLYTVDRRGAHEQSETT